MVGCEVALGDWQQFTSEEQRLIVYASFYGLQAPERVPYQKGFRLILEDHEVILPDIEFEYHSQCLTVNSYKLSKEEGEPEPVITPPPPSAPELEDPIAFDPKVTGIWDHLLGLMTDEQKAQLKEQAKSEDITASYRHVIQQKERPLHVVRVLILGDHRGQTRCTLEGLLLRQIGQKHFPGLRMYEIPFSHVGKRKQWLFSRAHRGYTELHRVLRMKK